MRLKLSIAPLLKAQRRWEKALVKATATSRKFITKPRKTRLKKSKLTEVSAFGSNPGNLRMLTYVPPQLPDSAPLVVVLHGCLQTARAYDEGSGWSLLARRHGFALVYAEQSQTNNPNRCFNWFQPHDARRGSGEALSIRQMVTRMRRTYSIDPTRIFVTGLSAGGAMTSVMLATYPEVFAGGGIIAGLPYGAASGMRQVMSAMKRPQPRSTQQWGDLVRSASSYTGPRPRVSIWHGTEDRTVAAANAAALLSQWTNVHGVSEEVFGQTSVAGHRRRAWSNRKGDTVIELYLIDGMGHGTPVRRTKAQVAAGGAGPFMLDMGISSSLHLARSWGLVRRKAASRRT
ncbi:PHB depolymerase family esterase [Microvirga sp. BSC39]|uniref:extracellular catalytic domain type 1 short-chain-length polyhydroxyalkanoate depolymerase n=1 Tax=Microvirga sp. BSC39 TaxID=1549810 RepID=UPI0005606BF1|nr:PHB depolymerase family esterase [Microvirga sp. BSC39]